MNLKYAVILEPTELMEGFKVGSDLMELANLLPSCYPFT